MIRTFLLSVLLASQAVAGEPTICPKDWISLKADWISLKADVPKDDEDFINGYFHVDSSGCIRLSYLGKVAVGGLTATEAAHLIDEDYVSRKVFAHPAVTVSIGAPDPSVAEIRVRGPVQHPGKYRMKTPATIEEAFAQAGGWGYAGRSGLSAKSCDLKRDVDGETVYSRISIHIDRKTGQIDVLDQAWKDYHLVEGDEISLPEVGF